MEIFIVFSNVVIAITVVVIAIYLIPALKQFKQTAATMEQTIKNLEIRIQPVIAQTQQTIKDISDITQSMKNQMYQIESSIDNIRNLINRGNRLSNQVFENIEKPLVEIMDTIYALQDGWKSFFSFLISKRKGV